MLHVSKYVCTSCVICILSYFRIPFVLFALLSVFLVFLVGVFVMLSYQVRRYFIWLRSLRGRAGLDIILYVFFIFLKLNVFSAAATLFSV